MKQLMVISAVGKDHAGMVKELTQAVLECGGNILESRMSALGAEFAMMLLVEGNWHSLAKLETDLPRLGVAQDLTLTVRRTATPQASGDLLPYAIDVVCLDQAGIVFNLSSFFAKRNIDIAELTTRSYAAAHTGAPMFSVQMVVNIPAKLQLATLREDFMEFCDQLNLDAIIEPIKN